MPEEREDVEATLQQDTAPDISQQKKKWRAIDWIAGGTFITEVLWGSWWLITQVCRIIPWNPHVSTEHFAQFYCGVGLGILSVGYLTLILWPIIFNIFKQGKDPKQDNDPRWFHARILSSGIVGGSYAFLLPAVMSLPEGGINSGGAAALRQAILLATGGLIALIALGETRRKNDNDKHKNDQEKEKNDRDHLRQVRAERRERYTKAIEQLGNEKASIRTGGVYTLTRLVDDWLEEESLSKVERLKEGQVIINNLCAYIRSPFTLASHYAELMQDTPGAEGVYQNKVQEFYADKATLNSEADVRLSIIKEIHDRLQGPDKNTPGAWSDFEYDFSGSTFFYPIDFTNSYYAKPINFSGSVYKGRADFCDSTYKSWADFSKSTYKGGADFSDSTYKSWASFSDSTYKSWADFSKSTYKGGADFRKSTYKGEADFSDSTYREGAYFSSSTYREGAYFSSSTYQNEVYFSDSTYGSKAEFIGSTYKGEAIFSDSTYKGEADFSDSTYQSWAIFSNSTYKSWANFARSAYQGRANFSDSIYQSEANFARSIYQSEANFARSTYQSEANFSGSIFCSEIYFGYSTHSDSFSRFTGCAPQFYDETNHKNTLFGSPDNNFTVENGRGYPIYRNLEGLPLSCKFLTSEQKEHLADKFQEIEKTNNKLREVKDTEEKANLIKKLLSFHRNIRNWRLEATTVNVEDVAAEDTES